MHPFLELKHEACFWLIRHGESAGNKEKKIQGHTDRPLTEEGMRHARESGRWLANRQLEFVCSSPLQRAEQTARIIMQEARIDPVAFEHRQHLKELDTGSFSNRSFDEIKESEPDLYREFRAHSWEVVPGAESMASLEQRTMQHWQDLVNKANLGCKTILSVTHVGVIQWLFKTSFHAGWNTWMPMISVSNCGIFQLVVGPRESERKPGYYAEWKIMNHTAWHRHG